METSHTLETRDRARIGYRVFRATDRPSERVIVLIHGLASNLTRWSEFVEHTTVKTRWDILRIDLRGHGESFTRRPIGLDIWCDDLRAVLDAEGYARAVLMGHSLGAQVALQFAARQAHRTAGLALIDPVFREALRGRALWLNRLAFAFRIGAAMVRALNALGVRRRRIAPLDLRALDREARATLLSGERAEAFVRRYSSPLADIRHFPTAHYLQELAALFAPLSPPEEFRMPVLVLLSRSATFTDPADTARLAKRFPRGETVIVDAYHWPLTERPEEIRRAVEAWCGRIYIDAEQ